MASKVAWVMGWVLLVTSWGAAAQSTVPHRTQATFQVRIAFTKVAGAQVASCAVSAGPPATLAAKGAATPTRLSCLSSVLAALHAPGVGPEGRSFMGSITLDDAALAALDPAGSGTVDEAWGRQPREIEVKF